MKTKLANYLNEQAEILKQNQYLEYFTKVPANFGVIGRQYGYRRSALRAIKKFQVKHFPTIPTGYQFWVNQIDDGCHEICGNKN